MKTDCCFKQEIGFLTFVKQVAQHSANTQMSCNEYDLDFKGLSVSGQEYFAQLLSKSLTLYLIEKGASVPIPRIIEGKLLDNVSFFNYQKKFSFSDSIFYVLKKLYFKEGPPDSIMTFESGDQLVLLMLTEKSLNYKRHSLLSQEWIEYIISHSFLGFLFYFNCLTLNDFNDVNWDELVGAIDNDNIFQMILPLRYLFRDIQLNNFQCVIDSENTDVLIEFSEKVASVISQFMLFIDKSGYVELYQPLCELAEYIFQDLSYLERIQKMVECCDFEYKSDKFSMFSKIARQYSWINALTALQEKASSTSAFSDDYNKMELFLHHYKKISEASREHVQETLAFFENET